MNVSRRTTLRALAGFAALPLSPLPAFSAEPPRRFRLIVLDVGGTIIQDRGDVVRTLMSSMQAHGVTVTAEEIGPWRGAAKHSVIEHFVAENTKLAVKERQTLSKKIYRDFVEQVSAAYKDVPPIAGTEDALRKLAERGYLLATNTGFEREIVMPILSRLGWVKYFKAIVASDDVSEGRPAPYMIFRAMELSQVHSVAEVLVVGDTPLDLQSAHNAGVGAAIGVLSGSGTEEQLRKEPHTAILPNVASLVDWLKP